MIAITLTVFTLFACILPASAAQTPTVEPLYDNATIASVSLSIASSGKATVKITLQGKSTPSTPKTPQPSIPKEPDNDVTSGSCFSDEAEQTFKKHKNKEKKNRL